MLDKATRSEIGKYGVCWLFFLNFTAYKEITVQV